MIIQINNRGQKLLQLWCLTPYINDIVNYLKNLENHRVKHLDSFISEEPRNDCISWLIEICEYYEIDRTVLHLAIYLFDNFVKYKKLEKDRYTLVAVTVIILANKFEGIRYCNISDIFNEFPCSFTIDDYLRMELSILNAFNWNLSIPTVAHFIDLYSFYMISRDDLEFIMGETSEFHLWKEASGVINKCLHIIIFDTQLLNLKPSLIASSIIAATRMYMKLFPTWTLQLICVTEYYIENLSPIANLILKNLHSSSS